ncbi:MAG: magnesium and cobalt transport protein CorA [Betaproteobacteria bacterium]|nr:magnesium and cobalt transport protein CorA [Betaproteobacteria bacterium]
MLINCVAYENGKKLADITVEAISEYLARPDCFVWVALKDPGPGELAVMQHEFGLHDLAVEDARKTNQRPKIDEYGDELFGALKTIELEGDEFQVGEVDVFVGPNYVLSVRNGTQRGFVDVRNRCEREPHLLRQGSGFVFYALMDAVVDRYFPVLDGLEAELESIEERIFAQGSARATIEALYVLKGKLMILKHAVSPLMEAAGKLYGGRVPAVVAGMGDYFRDVYDHLYRINQAIESIRDMIGTALQVNLGLIAITESEVNKKLSAWAAIFAVPTALAGIWGMNFKHMPELDWIFGYPFALSLITVSCVVLYTRFKKTGWL